MPRGVGRTGGVTVWDGACRYGCASNVLRGDNKSPIKSAFGSGFGVEGMVGKVNLGDTPSTLVVLL